MEIKTIRMKVAGDFDDRVNVALKDGWLFLTTPVYVEYAYRVTMYRLLDNDEPVE